MKSSGSARTRRSRSAGRVPATPTESVFEVARAATLSYPLFKQRPIEPDLAISGCAPCLT
jgi:hypothetical protein